MRGYVYNDIDSYETVRSGVCRTCGCTDEDCTDCIERFGEPCRWEEPDLCSACHLAVAIDARAAELAACLAVAAMFGNSGIHDSACTCFDAPVIRLDETSEEEARWLADVIHNAERPEVRHVEG